ncbi:MAG TPA: hypothetical protein DEP88_09600 [Verrucomicrobiales bacterium]|nr:hypothetical protein [Verrucomicrobiales bacterium]
MDIVMQILMEPFTWGLVLGLFLMSVIWQSMRKDIVNLKHENKRITEDNKELQGHLNTQLKINAKGNEQLQVQLDELREQNDNLRANVGILKQKAGRVEMRQLHLMESAVSVMREQAPGFAPAWEKAMRDAEAAEVAGEGGLKKLMRKVLPGGKIKKPTIKTGESQTEQGNQ